MEHHFLTIPTLACANELYMGQNCSGIVSGYDLLNEIAYVAFYARPGEIKAFHNMIHFIEDGKLVLCVKLA
jgi:hypothetical protein